MTGTPAGRLAIIKEAMEHILSLEDGKMRFLQAVTELSRAFALAVPHEHALNIRDEVGFFQAVLRKLLNDEIRIRSGRNLVQARLNKQSYCAGIGPVSERFYVS